MTSWSEEELRSIADVGEIRVAGRRDDGSLRPLVIVWHVVVDGALYVRSVRGTSGKWYRGVTRHHEGAISWRGGTHDVAYVSDSTKDAEIDAAYFEKYGRGSASRSITSAEAAATTLRIEPK